jgi:very-short-patch-repair endonuclease
MLPIRCKIFKALPWHSQRDLAEFFGKSVKTINEHLNKTDLIEGKNTVLLSSSNTEGNRRVVRNIKYYSFDSAAILCSRVGSFKHTAAYRDFLREIGIVFPETIPISCDEKNFKHYLSEIFAGILNIEFEYYIGEFRVDGIVKSLRVIFELDGGYHDKKNVKIKDLVRENYLKTLYPEFEFLRFHPQEFTLLANVLLRKLLETY